MQKEAQRSQWYGRPIRHWRYYKQTREANLAAVRSRSILLLTSPVWVPLLLTPLAGQSPDSSKGAWVVAPRYASDGEGAVADRLSVTGDPAKGFAGTPSIFLLTVEWSP